MMVVMDTSPECFEEIERLYAIAVVTVYRVSEASPKRLLCRAYVHAIHHDEAAARWLVYQAKKIMGLPT